MPTPGFHTDWIIGYGNPQRRDDGIGPCVVDRLKPVLKNNKGVHLLVLPQLAADLVEPLGEADRILFIDATTDNLASGKTWRRIHPETQILPYLTHHVPPAYLLWLLQALYHRSPPAWLISIQGYDFTFGEGLSPVVEKHIEDVSLEILQFIEKRIDRKKFHGKRYPYRSIPWETQQTSLLSTTTRIS